MTKSYADIQAQIEKLKLEADQARKREIAEVVGRMKEAIRHYELTPRDLFGNAQRPVKSTPGKGRKGARAVKYRDDSGNTWIGLGKRPDWLRAALAKGKSLDDFRV